MDLRLRIEKVAGNSARSPRHWCVQNNLVAYTASGGVVVATVDESRGKVEQQRFFCANGNQNSASNGTSGPNAYLNMAYGEPDEEVVRDSYGFGTNIDPTIISGASMVLEDYCEDASPSKLKDRVRSISCIAISPNKKYLAIGESGYQPRILLFSLAPDSSLKPVTLIYEHTFGVSSLVFSPDSKLLCSLGLVNDGFVYIWKLGIGSVSLQASNKCSAQINKVLWHEQYIVCLGLRFIKVWQYEDQVVTKPVALKGKNVLLGNYMNMNFVSGCVLNSDELLVATGTEHLMLLKLGEALKLVLLESPGFDFDSVLVDYEKSTIWFITDKCILRSVSVDSLTTSTKTDKPSMGNHILSALANVSPQYLLYLHNETVVLYNKETAEKVTVTSPIISNICGTKQCHQGILVFSKDGTIRKLDNSVLAQLELVSEPIMPNSLTAIDYHQDLLVCGDKYGTLSILSPPYSLDTPLYQTKAHASSINDIVYFEIDQCRYVASISRDRMIQVFHSPHSQPWDLLQTIPMHSGNLTCVQYSDSRIYVCSSDRTVSVHKLESGSIYQEKLITCKGTPVAMKIAGDDLVVSTNDKTVSVYRISESFALKRSMKLVNDKIGESLLVENIVVHKNLLIVSASDRSLRIFNYQTGKPLGEAWGHSDTILSLHMTSSNQLVSAGSDGCLFYWHLDDVVDAEIRHETVSLEDPLPMYNKVVRKIISTSPKKKVEEEAKKRVEEVEIEETKEWASPRLSSATLRRMEMKAELNSPHSKAVANRPIITNRPVLSPKKSLGNLRESPTRVARPLSPTRSPSPTKKPVMKPEDELDKILSQLSHVKINVEREAKKLSAQDKQRIAAKIAEITGVLGIAKTPETPESKVKTPEMPDLTSLLETYSNQLVEVYERKLREKSRPLFQGLGLGAEVD